MTNLTGQTLDRYRLLARLGEGGMGSVYKAHDAMLLRDVAVKVMHARFGRQARFRERFLREAQAAARLIHPGLVKVYDFGQADERLFIVMEFIPGGNLRQRLLALRADHRRLKLDEAVSVARCVAEALHRLHGHGVLHRDLKPDNIMLRPEPAGALPFQPVITDLGLARLAEADPITQAGALMGTPAYMSPEQALGQPTDARSDVYSLGVLLYEMSVGQTPFPVRDLAAAAQHHLHESPPAPGALRPGFPPALETVILTALSKTPEQRYPDAGVFAEALAALPPEALHAAETTFAPGEAVSLTTVLQSSTPAEGRGASIFQVFPTRLAGLAQDQVRVLRPDGTTSAVALPTGGLTLGRAADNGLALTGPHVSARHARIDFDGARYVVTDLNSTNGTYLGPVKLLPGVPEPWTPDRPLKVGDFYLRLELAAAPVPTAVGGSIVRSGNGRFSVTVAPAQLTVTPGGRAAAAVTVLNESDIVDHYALTVTGLPAAWASLEPRLRLMPGESHELRLTLALPRSPQARAGRHPFVVRVASEVAPDEVAEVRAAAMVAAYLEFEGRLRPARVRSGQPAAVWVANHGNAPAVFTLRFDEDGNLAFTPAAPSLRVEPGDSAAAEFRARPRRPRWIGPEAAHPFRALVSAEGAEPQALSGQLISRPPIPPWLPPVMFALCLLAGGGAWWASGWGKPPPPPATALTVTLVAPAATVDSPLLAATATALWLAADTDGDGLSNVMEVTVGTRPEAADTDGDGIDDNDEITLGRDPLQPEGVAAVTLPPTATPTPLVAAVAEATTATATPTSTSSATATAAATAASTGAPTATHLTPTSTFSPIPTSTRTPTSTHTPTPTGTATPTLTVTPTPTWTPTLPPLTGNLAPGASRSPDSIGSGNAFDGNLSTFWNITHRFTVTFSWGRTAVVERLLVWDRPQNSPDNNQINVLQVRLSNGLLKQFDMDSGGRRCIDIAVQPPQSITSVELTAWDASGGNGMSELEIWAGPKTTAITCANSGVLP